MYTVELKENEAEAIKILERVGEQVPGFFDCVSASWGRESSITQETILKTFHAFGQDKQIVEDATRALFLLFQGEDLSVKARMWLEESGIIPPQYVELRNMLDAVMGGAPVEDILCETEEEKEALRAYRTKIPPEEVKARLRAASDRATQGVLRSLERLRSLDTSGQ